MIIAAFIIFVFLGLFIPEFFNEFEEKRKRKENEKKLKELFSKNQDTENTALLLSNCCDAKIILEDFNGHGKCNACFENCTPRR